MSITKSLVIILTWVLSSVCPLNEASASTFTLEEIPWNCEWDLFNNLGEYWMTVTYIREGHRVVGKIQNSATRHNLTFTSGMNGEIHLSGTWNQSETVHGDLRIRFTSPTSFEATYNHQVAKNRWGKFTGSTHCTRVPVAPSFMAINWKCVWTSTYGEFEWSKEDNFVVGVYNKKLKKDVRGYLIVEEGKYILKGHYYKNGIKGGEIEFTFNDNSSFSGGYKQHGMWQNWYGSTDCEERSNPIGIDPQVQPLSISEVAWHCPWKTTYGEIKWRLNGDYIIGVYDVKLKKEIRGYLLYEGGELKLKGDVYKNGVKSTPVEMTFKTQTNFSGGYKQWGMWEGWHGEALCRTRD